MLLQWLSAAAAAKSRANAQKNTLGLSEPEPFWWALAAEELNGLEKWLLSCIEFFLDRKSSAVFIFLQ